MQALANAPLGIVPVRANALARRTRPAEHGPPAAVIALYTITREMLQPSHSRGAKAMSVLTTVAEAIDQEHPKMDMPFSHFIAFMHTMARKKFLHERLVSIHAPSAVLPPGMSLPPATKQQFPSLDIMDACFYDFRQWLQNYTAQHASVMLSDAHYYNTQEFSDSLVAAAHRVR